jgi:transcriptional regulator with XRE-family HTH domain
MKDFKERLIELRKKYDIDQQEFAKRIGMSKSAVSRYENHNVQPTLTVMLRIKQKFGVSLDWLAGYDTDENLQYVKIISDCNNEGISPDKLQHIIDAIKK